ncbi:MAG: GNAT family N-acetyltransferase [Candidatus Marsarchaeota archaeon]|nr:GNAT family N-acetyltransferase [Candidatus Marsarchaeota archaeon]
MEVRIRRYRESDKQELIRLIEGLKGFVDSTDIFDIEVMKEGYGRAGMQTTIKLLSKNKGVIYLAETKDKKIIGYSSSFIRPMSKMVKLGTKDWVRYGEVFDLYVDSAYRGQKVGKKLLHAAESYLKKVGCSHIRISVYGPNTKAQKFYKKLGYELYNVEYVKRV